jgi:hypothetical protein
MPLPDTIKTLIRNAWDDSLLARHERTTGTKHHAQGQHDRV